MIPTASALLIIDVQYAFEDPGWGTRNNPDAEENIEKLLKMWRKTHWPVIHVQHLSTSEESLFHPDKPTSDIRSELSPNKDEPLFQKHVNSAFIGTDLEEYLHEQNISSLVIVGITTNHCVSTTTRMADNLGFDTFLVEDATAAFSHTGYDGQKFTAKELHRSALANLDGEFTTIVFTENIIREMSHTKTE